MSATRDLLALEFDEDRARSILRDTFGERFVAFTKTVERNDPKGLYAIRRAGQIAAASREGKRVEVLFVRITGPMRLRRNRVGLRKAVDAYFTAEDEVSGLLAFYASRGESSWRLSYAYKRSARDEKGAFHTEATDTKRCTYLVGPGENVRTPADRLAKLAEAGEGARLADIEEAFSVEAVSEKFFDEYKSHYEKAVEELARPSNRSLFGLPARGEFDRHGAEAKSLRDFAKKLLGRLVFLKFLEKKGWLGATEFHKADGRRDFLHDLFKTYSRDFYVEALVPLFFETLNRPRKGDLFRLTGTKIPFLNGGLFENDYDIDTVNKRLKLSGGFFQNLLEFLDRYNFTVDEQDSDEEEIGVDPEMLGRIFERLIEDNEKDMNGTIYTPYAVVEFMCRNSLHLHLCRSLDCEREDERGAAIKRLLVTHEIEGLTKAQLKKIEAAAKDLKILDPAVGSGAFPLGMLKELVALRETLAEALAPSGAEGLQREALKREIIRSSLYGVDIDPGAVDIARLRLFLALVVDAAEPEPLPNLDFKIMQGDSLAEGLGEIPIVFDPAQYRKNRGKKTDELFGEAEYSLLNKKGQKSFMDLLSAEDEDVLALLDKYFDPDAKPEHKAEHRRTIRRLEALTVEKTLASNLTARLEAQKKADYAARLDPKAGKLKAAAKAAEAVERAQAQLDDYRAIASGIVDGSARERPYFLWHLYFHDAFESGGFDIIIGNPPYRANQENENDRAKNKAYPLIDARIKETFVAKSKAQKTKCYDLFARFFRLAFDFSLDAKRDTIVAFITNYAFIDARTYDGFRKDVREKFGSIFVVNLGGDVRANPKLSGPVNSIFGIQAGVAISLFTKPHDGGSFDLKYTATEEEARREEKISFIEDDSREPFAYRNIIPDENENWINQCDSDFLNMIPICSKEVKQSQQDQGVVFYLFSLGICTNRDEWAYDFASEALAKKIRFFIRTYNTDCESYSKGDISAHVSRHIKYTSELENSVLRKETLTFSLNRIIPSLYRPWINTYTYFDDYITHRKYKMKYFICDSNNTTICFSGQNSKKPFQVLATKHAPNLDLLEKTHCLGLYQIREKKCLDNITDWSLSLFRDHYKDRAITKKDIFHYVYAVLHNPAYRAKYALDLKRDYPRVPLYKDFRKWAAWGSRLMEIHIEFEKQPEARGIVVLPGDQAARKTHAADYRTDADKHRIYSGNIRFSDGSILTGIPPRVFDYRLGNKSAIEWVLDQYSERHWPSDADIKAKRAKSLREDERVLRDKFNSYRFADYKGYVISLIKKLVTISLETLDIQEAMAKEEDHGLDLREVYAKSGAFEEGAEMGEAAEGEE